ncbi:uncharacterized protein [Dermacentor albipictus]|uniref:uncharacterized protein isoform X1 n=1 Tax=Dermacentor albipictus TaxID=60249 RepID=UPI0031FDD5A1
MISSRTEAIFIIGIHTVQNIIGLLRFSYGFHRTGSENMGLKLDVCLGAESFANILSDVIIMFLLWQEENGAGMDVRSVRTTETIRGSLTNKQMTRVLGFFVAWNAIAVHICAFGNLTGLMYPPKWYTHVNANELSAREKVKIVAFWAPLIIFLAFWKLYYTSLIYEFYLYYKATKGRPFDYCATTQIGSGFHASVATEDRRTFSPSKTLNLTSDPVRRHSITAENRGAVHSKGRRASYADRPRRLSAAADERTDPGAMEMPRRHSVSSRRQSVAADGTAAGGVAQRRMSYGGGSRRQSVREDQTSPPGAAPIPKRGTAGGSRRQPTDTADGGAEFSPKILSPDDNVRQKRPPPKSPAATGASARARKHGSHAPKRSVSGEDRSDVGAPGRLRRSTGRRHSNVPEGELMGAVAGAAKKTRDRTQRQSGAEDDRP